jgi:hypothetical protein
MVFIYIEKEKKIGGKTKKRMWILILIIILDQIGIFEESFYNMKKKREYHNTNIVWQGN